MTQRGGPPALLIVLGALFATGPSPAEAICSDAAGRISFQRALRDTMVCAARRLRAVDGDTCEPATPPCAAAEFERVVELVGGLPDRPSPSPEDRRCRMAAFRGARRFVARRLAERQSGVRAQERSYRTVRLDRRCTTNGPPLGGRCGGAAENPDAARRCLRAALEGIVANVLGVPDLRPNVVLIVSDDQPQAELALLPRVQGLASQGVRFTNAFTSTPICAPARAGILTGQHATRHGVLSNGWIDDEGTANFGAVLLQSSSTLGDWFQAAGYRTASIGKYLNGYAELSPTIPSGWDEWTAFVDDTGNFFDYRLNENGTVRSYGAAPEGYSTDVLAEAAIRFVEDSYDRPFFLVFAPFAPHEPSLPAPRHRDALADLPPWRPPNWGGNIEDKPDWFRFFATPESSLPDFDPAFQQARESLLAVDDAISDLDARLERLGLTDNTIVLYTTDHGFVRGEHRWVGKQVPYEESISVPMILRYPLVLDAGTRHEELVLNLDIAPTLLELAGIESETAMDGRSLVDLVEGDGAWRDDILVQHFVGGFTVPPWDMVRTERYKLVRHPGDRDELYDLVADPYELVNLAEVEGTQALVSSLSDRLDRLLAD